MPVSNRFLLRRCLTTVCVLLFLPSAPFLANCWCRLLWCTYVLCSRSVGSCSVCTVTHDESSSSQMIHPACVSLFHCVMLWSILCRSCSLGIEPGSSAVCGAALCFYILSVRFVEGGRARGHKRGHSVGAARGCSAGCALQLAN